MASEYETVEDIVKEIGDAYETWKRSEIAELPTQYLMEWRDRLDVADRRSEEAHQREIAELRRRLKVAEEALGESKVAVCHTCDLKSECFYGTDKFEPCCIVKDIDKALAVIREEGGAK